MEAPGRDIQRPGLREVLPAPRRWHPRTGPKLRLLLAVLTLLGGLWFALVARAFYELGSMLLALAVPMASGGDAAYRDAAESAAARNPVRRSQTPATAKPVPAHTLPPRLSQGRETHVQRRSVEERSERPTPLSSPPLLEYHGSRCTGVFVYIVTVASDSPRRSAVSLAESETAQARLLHPGERVGAWELLAITDDWTGVNPTVWLVRDGQVCRTGLTGNPARVKAAQQRQLQQEQQERERRRQRRRRRARRRR